MKTLRLSAILLFFFLILAAAAVQGQSVDYDGLRFTSIPDLGAKNFFGYHFARVLVTNSSDRERKIRLFFRSDYPRGLEEVSKSFVIGPGEVKEEALFFPIVDITASGLMIEVDGLILKGEQLANYLRVYRNFYQKKQALVDAKIAQSDFTDAFSAPGMPELDISQFEGSNSQLYRSWLGYSQFNLLLFQASSLSEMPPAVLQAILDYVRAGGTLLVTGKIALPSDFSRKLSPASEMAGFSLEEFNGGFGKVIFGPEDLLKRMVSISGPFPQIVSDPFSGISPQHSASISFKNDEIESVSAKWLMLIIYAFAFLIGPVNIFILHRMKKRIFVFFTVPAASIICCGIIYGYYIFFESHTLLVKQKSITLLDERNNRAITLGGYSVFSAKSRPEGLKFDFNTEVFPFIRQHYRANQGGFYFSADDSQHFSSGWIRPKIERSFNLRMIQTRRERIHLENEGDKIFAVNGLGADLRWMMVRLPDGSFYALANTRAGQRGLLERKNSRPPVRLVLPDDVFASGWSSSFSDMQNKAINYLQPGQYVAVLENSPFFSQEIDKRAQKTTLAVVWGIMNPEAEQ